MASIYPAASAQGPAGVKAGAPLFNRLIDNFTIEVSTREDEMAIAAMGLGTRVFLPWLPTTTADELVGTALRCTKHGLRPVPHIAARRITSHEVARRLLDRLHHEAGVNAVLLIGGEVPDPLGPYACAMDLLETGAIQAVGITGVGVGGYPEGHPTIPTPIVNEALEKKVARLQSLGLETFIASQFCFDAGAIADWVSRLRSRGISVPIRVGVAGPTDLQKLIRLGLRCGVGASMRFLKGRLGALARLATTYEPTDLIEEIAAKLDLRASSSELGIHVFAFGGVGASVEWLKSQRSPAAGS